MAPDALQHALLLPPWIFRRQEREFRGFGRVEQVDVESYGRFAGSNAASPYITADRTLYQPP
jgi:hypothetical protein